MAYTNDKYYLKYCSNNIYNNFHKIDQLIFLISKEKELLKLSLINIKF